MTFMIPLVLSLPLTGLFPVLRSQRPSLPPSVLFVGLVELLLSFHYFHIFVWDILLFFSVLLTLTLEIRNDTTYS